MTAEPGSALIYARGGGHGHAMRGAELQRALCARGLRVELLVEAGSARYLVGPPPPGASLSERSWPDALARAQHDLLVVDTFPRGWRGEIAPADLRRFGRTLLVARYNRDPAFAEEARAFDAVLNPYPAELDEWPAAPARSWHAGWLVRPPPTALSGGGDRFVVFDPGARLPAVVAEKLGRRARALGLRLSVLRAWPAAVRAAKLLCIGAGYNTVYELAAQRADVRFFPLARRHDDQARRARRVGRSVERLGELLRWLAAPERAEPFAGDHRYTPASLEPIGRAA
jgi:hypothetical protein